MNVILDSIGYGNFILVILVLVFVHELGHYLVARACGISVEVFSIGFGKEIFGWTDKRGMRWKLSLIPLGGYVKMKGEMLATQDGNKSDSGGSSDSFHRQSLLKRILVVAAGPFANYVYAILLLALMFIFAGQPQVGDYYKVGIGAVASGSAAEQSGLQQGDIITQVNDRSIESFQQLALTVGELGDKPLSLQVFRQGRNLTITATPRRIEQNGQVFYRLGIGAPPNEYVKQGVGEALWSGVKYSYYITSSTIDSITGMFKGTVSTDELGGPVRIAQFSKDFGDRGLYALLNLMVILSVSLGFFNLLPIPMLDGGHLLFYAIEAIRGGRPISARTQGLLMRLGLGVLLFLIIWITLNDIRRIVF